MNFPPSAAGPTSSPAPRRNWPRLLADIAVTIVVIAVAATAFILSYPGVHAIALQGGVSTQLARLYPGLFDAVLVVACVAAVMLRDGRWWARSWAWLVAIVMLGAIGTADVLHAADYTLRHRPTEGIVAGAPVVGVLLAFSLLLTMLRQTRTETSGQVQAADRRAAGQSTAPFDAAPFDTAPFEPAPIDAIPMVSAGAVPRPPAPPIALPPAPADFAGQPEAFAGTREPGPDDRADGVRETGIFQAAQALPDQGEAPTREEPAVVAPAPSMPVAEPTPTAPAVADQATGPDQPNQAAEPDEPEATRAEAEAELVAEPPPPAGEPESAGGPRPTYEPRPTPQAIRYASSAAAEDWESEVDPDLAGQVYPVLTSDPDIDTSGYPDEQRDVDDADAPPFATAPFASVPKLNRVRVTPIPPTDDEE